MEDEDDSGHETNNEIEGQFAQLVNASVADCRSSVQPVGAIKHQKTNQKIRRQNEIQQRQNNDMEPKSAALDNSNSGDITSDQDEKKNN